MEISNPKYCRKYTRDNILPSRYEAINLSDSMIAINNTIYFSCSAAKRLFQGLNTVMLCGEFRI